MTTTFVRNMDIKPDGTLSDVCRQRNIRVLSFMTCDSVITITDLPNLVRLFCAECTLLRAVSDLPTLTHLDCRGCTSLESISDVHKLITLDCEGCTSLEFIPDLPELGWLDCRGCTSLKRLPLFSDNLWRIQSDFGWTVEDLKAKRAEARILVCIIHHKKWFPEDMARELQRMLNSFV